MAPVILAKDLYKCYPGFAPVLRGVNVSVEAGEMMAVMGPSGCGKSTMLHILGMLHAPDSGSLEILGTDVLALDSEATAAFRRRNMGFVMQSSNMFEHSTVFENVEFPLIYERIPPEERWERVIRALDLVRLSARVNYRSNRLSGGEQQRVAIARAMVNNPRILLADEPTGALDSRTSQVIMQNFRTLAHEGGVAMIIVTHDPKVAEFCDSAYSLEEGLLVCRKHTPPPPAATDALSQPGAIKRRMHVACVGTRFPVTGGVSDVRQVQQLYHDGLLSRIYAVKGPSLAELGGTSQYGLPVPVRRVGLPGALFPGMRALYDRWNGRRAALWRRFPCALLRHPLACCKKLCLFAAGARMARWARQEQIEHLHALDAGDGATAAWIASGLTGIPFSFSISNRDFPGDSAGLVSIKAADAAFVRCFSQYILDQARANAPGVPAEKFRLLHALPTFTDAEADEVPVAIPGKTPQQGIVRVLAAGHVTSAKGIDVLLQACSLLVKKGVPLELTVAGDGHVRRMKWRARWLGLRKKVHFPGIITHDRLGELLHQTQIFVSPGRDTAATSSALPQSLLEAMRFGLPIVASDLPGIREVLRPDQNALLVPPASVTALAQALDRLARSPEQAAALGKTAKADAIRLLGNFDDESLLTQELLRWKARQPLPA